MSYLNLIFNPLSTNHTPLNHNFTLKENLLPLPNKISFMFLYFDPGLGAMIAQAAVAAVAAVALFSKTVMYKIKSFLGLHKEEDDSFDNIDIDDNQPKDDQDNSTK